MVAGISQMSDWSPFAPEGRRSLRRLVIARTSLVWSCGLIRCAGVILAVETPLHAQLPAPVEQAVAFRFGFSSEIVGDLNESDAKAAMKVWGRTVVRERGIDAPAEPVFFAGLPEMIRAFEGGTVDAVSLTVPEYFALTRTAGANSILLGSYGGQAAEEYLVLTHRTSGITRLEELRGRAITVLHEPRTALSEVWLETLLLRRSLGPADRFFAALHHQTKVTKVVLPVFFRQADACVVHRRAFDVLCELNPQLGRDLVILETSPKLVPGLLCFRDAYQPAFRSDLITALTELDRAPAGRQLLTIFQCDRIQPGSDQDLASARQLLDEYASLRRAAGITGVDPLATIP